MEPMNHKLATTHKQVAEILEHAAGLCDAWGWDFNEIVGCGNGHYESHAAAAMMQRCERFGGSTSIGVAFGVDHTTVMYWLNKPGGSLPEYPHHRRRVLEAIEAVDSHASIFDFNAGKLGNGLSRAPFDVWERLLVWAHLTCVAPRMSVKDAADYTTRRGHSTILSTFNNAEKLIARHNPPAWQVDLYRSWRPSPVVNT